MSLSFMLNPPVHLQSRFTMEEGLIESLPPTFTAINSPRGRKLVSSMKTHPIEPPYHLSGDSPSPTCPWSGESPKGPLKEKLSQPSESDSTTPSMEKSRQSTFSPVGQPDAKRRRNTAPRESPNNSYWETQDPESHLAEHRHDDIPSVPITHARTESVDMPNGVEQARATDLTEPVPVGSLKRKKRFASRTKTGCGTCRKRKSKCDEAKPECNNCTRSGFICEWYTEETAPKKTISKPPPPLIAKQDSLLPRHNPQFHHHTLPAPGYECGQGPQHPRHSATSPPTTAATASPPSSYHGSQQRPIGLGKKNLLSVQPFRPHNPELMGERAYCTKALDYYNNPSNPPVERGRYLRAVVLAIGSKVNIAIPFQCGYGYNLSIGDNVTIGPRCYFLDSTEIRIGRNTRIEAGVTVDTMRTPLETQTIRGSTRTEVARKVWIGEDVWIGENVWIGAGVIIEAGVRIGTGAIVHAGSVVVHDLQPNCDSYGNPAFRFVRYKRMRADRG